MKNCPICGKKVYKGQSYCKNCGANLYATPDQDADVQTNFTVKKKKFNYQQLIIIGACILFAGFYLVYHSFNDIDKYNHIDEVMAENYSFKNSISGFMDVVNLMEEDIHECNLYEKDEYSYKEVSNDKKDVYYSGAYQLNNGDEITVDYNDHKESEFASLIIVIEGRDKNDFISWVKQYSSLIENLSEHALDKVVEHEEIEKQLEAYYEHYKVNSKISNYVPLSRGYVDVMVDDGYRIEFFFDQCKKVYK